MSRPRTCPRHGAQCDDCEFWDRLGENAKEAREWA